MDVKEVKKQENTFQICCNNKEESIMTSVKVFCFPYVEQSD